MPELQRGCDGKESYWLRSLFRNHVAAQAPAHDRVNMSEVKVGRCSPAKATT